MRHFILSSGATLATALALAGPAAADVYIRAPFVRVQVGDGVHVRAPFVNVFVPSGPRVYFVAPPAPPGPVFEAPPPEAVPDPTKKSPRVKPMPPPQVDPDDAAPVPAQPEQVLTPEQFAKAFQPKAGNYEVTLLNPVTRGPTTVRFTLPQGAPRRVDVSRTQIEFDYGPRRYVRIRFDRDGAEIISR